MDKQEILSQINSVKATHEKLTNTRDSLQKDYDNFEIEVSDDDYDNLLNDIDLSVTISGIDFSPSEILKNCDPVAYRCGKSDYENSLDKDDYSECQDLLKTIDDLDYEIDNLSDEIENLESELSECELGEYE